MAKRGDNRRGNGAGWGGAAKGAGSSQPAHSPFEEGNRVAVGRSEPNEEKARRIQALKDHLYSLATTAEKQEVQVRAAEAWLNREIGTPVATNVTLNVDDIESVSTEDLRRELAELFGANAGAKDSAGTEEADGGKPTSGIPPLH